MSRLTDLLRSLGLPDTLPVTHVTADSRNVKPGTLFLAYVGIANDGKTYIAEAVKKGAVAVVADAVAACEVPLVVSDNPRLVLSTMAAALYPAQPEYTVAVTGTDGKTSTADFFRQLADMRGHKAASIGTLGALGKHRKELAPGLNTTPDPVTLHQLLGKLAAEGYTHAAMEASSHGLHQYRLHGVRVKAAAYTNLTRDHLDYHVSVEEYFAAKLRLFTDFELDAAVVNADDEHAAEILSVCKKRGIDILTYGKKGEQLRLLAREPVADGQHASFEIFGVRHDLHIPLVGAFQLWNMLTALGLLAACGEDPQALAHLLPKLAGVPGRLEPAGISPEGASVYVDYAHTPAALANVLTTLRPHAKGRLLVVFGCGGNRDKGKRPLMAQAAGEHADVAILTDDNPRNEDPAQIRAEALAGFPGAKEVADRKEAIYAAVAMLKAGDVLLVAGKGHEKTQTIGNVAHPFDDVATVQEALKTR